MDSSTDSQADGRGRLRGTKLDHRPAVLRDVLRRGRRRTATVRIRIQDASS